MEIDLSPLFLFNGYMLPPLQQKVYRIGLMTYLLFLGGFLVAGYLLFHHGVPPLLRMPSYVPLPVDGLFGREPQGILIHLASELGSILLALPASGVLVLHLRNVYRKTPSVEVFFLSLFYLTLALESLRIVNLLFFAQHVSIELRLIATRAVYLGRLFGMFCLLASSLYAVGLKYANLGLLLGAVFLLSLTLSSILPIDATVFTASFLYRLGDVYGYRFVDIAMGLIYVLNFAGAGFIRASRRFLWIALAAALVFLGRELFLHGTGPLILGIGVGFLLAGGTVFGRQISQYYLWS